MTQLIRVFISSPGDVADERAIAPKVIDQLNYAEGLRDHFALKALAWEQVGVPMPANQSAQKSVDTYMIKPSQCEVVVVIFWSRMGTPMEMHGEHYLSGTHYEFMEAIQGVEKNGSPLVLVYKRTQPINFSSDDPDIFRKIDQHKKVQDFFATFNNDDGSIKHPYKTYELPSNFAELLEKDLKAYLFHLRDHPLQQPITKTIDEPAELWQGSPFPGLRAFEPKDAPIFFGRGRETDALVKRVKDPNNRFTAVVGASGSGKSSLVGAGLIPRLQHNSEHIWKIVTFTPDYQGVNDPFVSLASALKSDLGIEQRDLPKQLHHDSKRLNEIISIQSDNTHILLFIDQFEELFTTVLEEHRQPFVDMLAEIQTNPNVRTVVTLRGDFYGKCIELPRLAELLESSTYPLSRPSPIALYEMITRPALRAGLIFDDGLVEQILDDTGDEPGALALMAYALDELYKIAEGRNDKNLSFADYETLGGVQGAIGKRAENTFNAMGVENPEKVLEGVFLHLVQVDENNTATRRRELKENVAINVDAETLVDTFTNARLLVQNRGENNSIYIEVAHEAILRNWERLAEWIELQAEGFHLLNELHRAVKIWVNNERKEEYLWKHERQQKVFSLQEKLGIKFDNIINEFLRPEVEILLEEFITLTNTSPAVFRRDEIGGRLLRIGNTDVIYGLINIFRNSDFESCENASYLLTEIEDRNLVPILINFLNDENPQVRENIAYCLGMLDDDRVIQPLLNLIKNESNEMVLRVAIMALGELRSTEFIDIAEELLEVSDINLRGTIAETLGEINDPRAIPILLQLLKDTENSPVEEGRSRRVCDIATRFLKSLCTINDFSQLENYLSHPDPELRSRVLDILAEFKYTESELLETFIPLLIKTVQTDSDGEIQLRASLLLARKMQQYNISKNSIEKVFNKDDPTGSYLKELLNIIEKAERETNKNNLTF